MRAKNREQYIEAWRDHIKQLIHPMIDSATPLEEWERIQRELHTIVDTAAARTFPEDTPA